MKNLLLLFATTLAIVSCEKNDPEIPNEEELITTVIYKLTPKGGGQSVELKFQDLDGPGGQNPTVNSAVLKANTVYEGTLSFLNESETPVENITEEVLEEAEDHQVFFQTSPTLNVSVSYQDMDKNGKPIGIKTNLNANTKTNGSLKIILRHEPNKDAMNVASGDITNAGGETDIEVNFGITVQ